MAGDGGKTGVCEMPADEPKRSEISGTRLNFIASDGGIAFDGA
jgi:hypothetical protein